MKAMPMPWVPATRGLLGSEGLCIFCQHRRRQHLGCRTLEVSPSPEAPLPLCPPPSPLHPQAENAQVLVASTHLLPRLQEAPFLGLVILTSFCISFPSAFYSRSSHQHALCHRPGVSFQQQSQGPQHDFPSASPPT